jgi:hypothetical protein
LSCVNPCSTAAGIAAGTPSTAAGIGGAASGTPANTSQCFLNCTKSETNLHARLLRIAIRLAEGSVEAVEQQQTLRSFFGPAAC